MFRLLWLIPALPIAGFLILALGRGLGRRTVTILGTGMTGLSAVVALALGVRFVQSPPDGGYTQRLWTWMSVDGFAPEISLYLDALSLTMTLVITVVGFLILVYSASYMAKDDGYARFFAYMNLFVGSMLILVLGGDLLLLYLGWEGVGLCSYLLIGFWYKTAANARAAMKAFIVTRVGDAAMAMGLFLIFFKLGTLDFRTMGMCAVAEWPVGSGVAVAAAALLLGGALGKSAQLPLQTWLPDAMAGPTPVSALIHAATMVTAGVYLIARTHVVFELAPPVMNAVAVIGAATLLLAGVSALVQDDIKRVLAYSTMSQIGYMFLALGVGAWGAGIFHFVTHAVFKALLFLAAGTVILRLHEEQNMFRMGGLRSQLPVAFWTFLVGGLSLSALPPATGGLASKDLILYDVWTSDLGGPGLWLAGVVGAFITSLYTFRMIFLTFCGPATRRAESREGALMGVPLVALAIGSVLVGLVELPRTLGDVPIFSRFIESALPVPPAAETSLRTEAMLQLVAESLSLAGLVIAYVLYVRRRAQAGRIASSVVGARLVSFWQKGWGFDRVYDTLLVDPFVRLSRLNKADVVDSAYDAVAWLSLLCHRALSRTQTGKVRWYATGFVVGAIVILGFVVWK